MEDGEIDDDASTSRCFYDEGSGLTFDALTGTYYAFNAGSASWVPAQPPAGEPETDATIRLVVQSSSVPGLSVDSVLIVDGNGVSLGRDRNPGVVRVRLKELPVSKDHATIFWNKDDEQPGFAVVDLGSTQGTFLNGPRLSDAKHSSKPFALKNGDALAIGTTVFEVHVHESPWWTCERCKLEGRQEISAEKEAAKQTEEPTPAMGRKETLRQQHREEMNNLKRKLVGEHRSEPPEGYLNRSALRRKRDEFAGPPARRTRDDRQTVSAPPTTVDSNTRVSGKGAQMLAKQGYSGGGLGKRGDGIEGPIVATSTVGKTGLGHASNVGNPAASAAQAADWREEVRRKARERFEEMG